MTTNALWVGRTLAGKYLLEAEIGGGSMGRVFRARHVQLGRTVALKVLHKELNNDSRFAARFLREAQTAFRVDHPNSIRIIDYGEEPDGTLYMAMEYLEGRDLLALLQSEDFLSTERITGILLQTLSALVAAHDLGILHRDLKPENIMVVQGRDDDGRPCDIVKVCDFGIAKVVSNDEERGNHPIITSRGTIVGTPEYMSPEQGRGEVIDTRSDIYSLGVVLFYLLAGRLPYVGDSPLSTMVKHLSDDIPTLADFPDHVDPHLVGICIKALQKKPEQRFANAREMKAALREARLDLTMPIELRSRPSLDGGAPSSRDLPSIVPVSSSKDDRRDLKKKKARPSVMAMTTGLVCIAGSVFLTRDALRTHHARISESLPAAAAIPALPMPKLEAAPTTVVPGRDPLAELAAQKAPVATPQASSAVPANKVEPGPTVATPVTSNPVASATKPSAHAHTAPKAPTSDVDGLVFDPSKVRVAIVSAKGISVAAARKSIPLHLLRACFREDQAGKAMKPRPFQVTLRADLSNGRLFSHAWEGAFGGERPTDLSACASNNLSASRGFPIDAHEARIVVRFESE